MSREKGGAYTAAHLRRVVVIGTTGSGKTTLARELADAQGATHVEFDAYRHGPNWTETPDEEFCRLLAEALSGDRWVADGNYNVTRDTVWPRATAIVWLDLPFGLVFWRLLLRTLRRGILRETLWKRQQGKPLQPLLYPGLPLLVGIQVSLATQANPSCGARRVPVRPPAAGSAAFPPRNGAMVSRREESIRSPFPFDGLTGVGIGNRPSNSPFPLDGGRLGWG